MLRVAVVGVGSMGRNHVRVYRDMAEVQLVAVADQFYEAAQSVGQLYQIPTYTDYFEMVERERPDAVSVVVPTQEHFRVAQILLEMGCHVLVEKPIARTLDEAKKLIDIAHLNEKILMVGHIERYNPAIIELKRRLDTGELGRVFHIHTRRLGPMPTRIHDVGVTMDLATHDLDIMRYVTGSEVLRVYAEARREVHPYHEDMLDGMVRFANGTVGLLEISWLTPTKIREICVTGERGMFRADYVTQDLYFYENHAANGADWASLSIFRGVKEGAMTRFAIHKKEPLRAELEAFIHHILHRNSPLANGYDGQMALRLALALIESAQNGSVQPVNIM